MRKFLIILVFAPVAVLVVLTTGCGGDPTPKFQDKAPKELEKKLPDGGGAKPKVD